MNDLNLDQKIMELKKLVPFLQKDQDGHGYKYVSEDSILLAINEKMIELGLKLTPRFVAGSLKSEVVNYQNAKGQPKTDVLVTSELEFVWKDILTKEEEIVPWGLIGQQADGSQAMGSGLTYSNRYFLIKYFNIPTSEEDPDKIRSEQAAEEERKKLSSLQTKIKSTLGKLIEKYQTQARIYELLGTNKEQFTNDYNDQSKWTNLLEQMELILKNGDK